MPRVLPIALIMGVVAGLLVGGFHNLFTVPVMERAIELEEQRAEAGGAVEEEHGAEVSLGMQRIGMVVGLAVLGLILGLVFTGLYHLVRRTVPKWQPLAIALAAGALGFWAITMFPFFKFPLNPPGVGEAESLAFRQGLQALFILLSVGGMVAAVYGVRWANGSASAISQRVPRYMLVAAAYIAFAVVIGLLIPGNPDPTPVPVELLQRFRTLTVIGHLLLWLLLALGVAGALMWYRRSAPGGTGAAPREMAHTRS